MTTIEDLRKMDAVRRQVPDSPSISFGPDVTTRIIDYLAERDGQPTQGECRGCADYRRVLEGEKIATRDATRECNELLGENQRLRAQLAACERERDAAKEHGKNWLKIAESFQKCNDRWRVEAMAARNLLSVDGLAFCDTDSSAARKAYKLARAALAACERERDELLAKAKPDEGWRGKCEVRLCDQKTWWGVNSPDKLHFLTNTGWLKHHEDTLNSGYFSTESDARAALAAAPPPPDAEQPASGADDEAVMAAAKNYASDWEEVGSVGWHKRKVAFLAGCAHARGGK